MLFQIVLHTLVQRQHNAVAILCRHIFFIIIGHIRAQRVGCLDHPACNTLKGIIIMQLHAVQTLAVIIRKADDLRGKGAIFIIPLGILRGIDAGKVIFFQLLHDFIRNIRIHPPCYADIGYIPLDFFQHIRILQFQMLR